jgi:hypothetical protein
MIRAWAATDLLQVFGYLAEEDFPFSHRLPAGSLRAPPALNRHPCRFALHVFGPSLRFKSSSDYKYFRVTEVTLSHAYAEEDLNLHALAGTRT